ncbi:MAG: universal stress protein [Halobacteriales archaeon]
MAILVAYDGSPPARKAVEHAVAEHPGAELVLLRVFEAAGGSLEAGFDLVRERLKAAEDEVDDDELAVDVAEEVRELLDAEDVDYRTETAIGKPAREVVAYVEEHDVDQVVVGSHGRSGVSRVLLGSVAEKVVRRSPTPVTVVR